MKCEHLDYNGFIETNGFIEYMKTLMDTDILYITGKYIYFEQNFCKYLDQN